MDNNGLGAHYQALYMIYIVTTASLNLQIQFILIYSQIFVVLFYFGSRCKKNWSKNVISYSSKH